MDYVGVLTTALAVGYTGLNGAASSTIMVQCNTGTRVYIRCRNISITCNIFGSLRTNVFSGLLYSDDA